MKNQTLFSSKDKRKQLKCRLLQFLFGALKVKKKTCILSREATVLFPVVPPLLNGPESTTTTKDLEL